jgi:hypothetical protein
LLWVGLLKKSLHASDVFIITLSPD